MMENKINLDILCNSYTHNKLQKISNRKGEISAPVNLLPKNVTNVKVTEIRKGTLYCLNFMKL